MPNKLNMTVYNIKEALDWAEKNGVWADLFGKMSTQWKGPEFELQHMKNCARGCPDAEGTEGEDDIERGQKFLDWWASYHIVDSDPKSWACGDVMVECFLAYQRKGV